MNKKKLLAIAVAVSTFVGSVPVMAANFTDANDVPWEGAKTYINSVADSGLMVGDYDLKDRLVFRARDGVSYCETMQLVYALVQNATGNSVSSTVQNKWTSVMNGYKIPTWAQPAIAYGLENSIITISDIPGFVDSKGSVSVKATRQDVAMMFGRAMQSFGTLKTNPSLSYNDSSAINSVAAPYVDLLTTLNVLTGDDLGNFNPKNSINRAEMAVMVSKSYEIMKTGQSKSVTGTVKSVTSYSSSTTLVINDGSSDITITGTDSIAVLDPSSQRVLLSSIKEGYSVVASYSGSIIQSVLITSTGSSSSSTTTTAGLTGTYYSMTERYIKIKVDGTVETHYFIDSDYENTTFYINGSKSKYDTFEDKATTSSTVVLTLDNYDQVMKVDMSNTVTGTFSSISDTLIKIKVNGSTESYTFDGKKYSNVDFMIDGKSSTYSKFSSAAGTTLKVALLLDDDDYVKEANLISTETENTGKFVSMSSSVFKVKIDSSTESYYYPSDDYENTTFYIDSKSTTYAKFKAEVSEGDTVKIELDSKGCLKEAYCGDIDEDDDNTKGTLVSIKSDRIVIKKTGSSTEKTYYYKNEDSDDVSFYFEGKSKSYDYVKDNSESGYGVELVLNSSDAVTAVYITEDSDEDASGEITKVYEKYFKSTNGNYNFVDEDIDDCSISIIDGDSTIKDGDKLIDAVNKDDKVIKYTATLNSSGEVKTLKGYVSKVYGKMTGINVSSKYIKVKADSGANITYYLKNSSIDIEVDSNYKSTFAGLESAYEDRGDDHDEVEVILILNSDGKITSIEAKCD